VSTRIWPFISTPSPTLAPFSDASCQTLRLISLGRST
jgi:hypothetical protein